MTNNALPQSAKPLRVEVLYALRHDASGKTYRAVGLPFRAPDKVQIGEWLVLRQAAIEGEADPVTLKIPRENIIHVLER